MAQRPPATGRIRRLAEELEEAGYPLDRHPSALRDLVLEELDYALRPAIHERRVPAYGSIVEPTSETAVWERLTTLTTLRRPLDGLPAPDARRFADGVASWLVRYLGGRRELAVFDRPAGSERDLVILAEATGGAMVQRHPAGYVRLVDPSGVMRWDGMTWHHEPPLHHWIDAMAACAVHGDRQVLTDLLEFAVHDLGARGVGALLVYRPTEEPAPSLELRQPAPPALRIGRPFDLAPLGHALRQIDGAAVFDAGGTLRQMGVRLVPSPLAEATVEPYGGMRHTSARRYSFDDPTATVIAVSEDGPVTVLRRGELVGRSDPEGSETHLQVPEPGPELVEDQDLPA